MTADALTNPVINGPYDPPQQHFELGSNGTPTGTINPGRRASESFVPIAPGRGRKGNGKRGQPEPEQQAFDTDIFGERREVNTLINDIRREVELWRNRGYPGATPISRKLMQHWADPARENRVLFCQREAAETAIFLAEVAGRHGTADYRTRLEPENAAHNNGLPRIALKMATGTGKTVVMAMLIAWHTLNKVHSPNDARFSKRFLVVTPGITIRDRLRVLLPSDPGNYFRERDLVPADLWSGLGEAQVVIVNYHQFLLRDRKEIQGVASNTRKILRHGKSTDPFKETPDGMVSRVLRDFSGGRSGKGSREIVVFNDEAHHCYQDKPLEAAADDLDAAERKEAQARNADARVWFKGLQAVMRKSGIKTVYDLSATPFYLKGSGYLEGFIFPWVVSDFSLMDAIESGIVKVPRLPVDDDASTDVLVYRDLWDDIAAHLPKRTKNKADAAEGGWVPPARLEGALKTLYRSYEKAFADWEARLREHGEPPPVFIVVCPNTVVSKLVYDWIAGQDIEIPLSNEPTSDDTETRARPGELSLLSNVVDGRWLGKPRTILIDSAQLESGEAMKDDFKAAARHEIETFKNELRARNASVDVDNLTDEDLLREVMNTVGKPGRLGEGVRCVVSVSMLTEGWDANTVTHILGVRAFRSRLLCEQVVGRALRRRSYAVNDDGMFDAEYAEVFGVPFDFIPNDQVPANPKPRVPAVEVYAVPTRADLRIEFPRLTGYRFEIPDEHLEADFPIESHMHIDAASVATWNQTGGIVGATEEQTLDDVRNARRSQVAYLIAREVLRRYFTAHEGVEKRWLFPRLVEITKQWLDDYVTVDTDRTIGMLLLSEGAAQAAEKVHGGIVRQLGNRTERLLPILQRFDPVRSTDDVHFFTRKTVIEATKSHINRVVLDGIKGNTWEEELANLCEQHPQVAAYVKNDSLGFSIPYVHKGISHEFVPDFLLRLAPNEYDAEHGITRTLIVEVSGGRKDQQLREAKAGTARDQWCVAVNNDGRFGRWGFTEIRDMTHAAMLLNNAITDLYADGHVTGAPD